MALVVFRDLNKLTMILGDLPAIKCLLPENKSYKSNAVLRKLIKLDTLEVVQLFHVSPIKNRESILTYGLCPKSRIEGKGILYGPRIFVSSIYEETAFDYVNYEEVDVWSFYLPKQFLTPDEYSSYANHYYIEIPIPFYKLTLFETR